jgi:acyl-CoA synthetase (AMP-forming)/AMP-acid ligase II
MPSRQAPPTRALLPTSLDFLRLQARRQDPGGVFFGDRRLSYADLADATGHLADWLTRRGLTPGHHIALMAANEPAFVAMLFATWGLGATVVPISLRSTAAETSRLLEHSNATALLCDAARADVARDAAAQTGIAAFVCKPDLPLTPKILRRGKATLRRSRGPSLAAIAYTSGTTGAPKGVMLTHENFLWATLACAHARGDTPSSVGACLSPLTHTPVLVSHLLCRILLGSTAVLLERFDLPAVLEAVERFGITDLSLIGGMVFDVVAMGSVSPNVRDTVRKVSVGGAPTPMEAKRALAKIFPNAEVIEAYGQTESTDGVTMARGTSVFDREGTVGRPNPHVIVAVRRADGSLAGPGDTGDIVIGGPTVMAGYYRARAATEAVLRDGWLYTGDLGHRDADGYIFLTGRSKDVIITGGENVSPTEVEDVLRTHPAVADVAVIGTPHPRWGEQVTAVVVSRDGKPLDAEQLAAFAGERLAGFKKPRRFEFVAALPRNAANKVQTHVLKQQFRA